MKRTGGKTITRKRRSSAMVLIGHVWNRNCETTGHSWARVNRSMQLAVRLAIHAGLRWHRSDFTEIQETMNGGYWFGESKGEQWYRLAIEQNNASAIQSYEQFRGRKPFIVQSHPDHPPRHRLHVGSEFLWRTKSGTFPTVRVTSFAQDQSYLTACSYKYVLVCGAYGRERIDKRFTITRQDIRDYHAWLRQMKKEQEQRAEKEKAAA